MALFLAYAIGACAAIVGIEDAEFDPTFTGAGGDGAGGDGAGGQAGDGAGGLLGCARYCDTVLANCTDEHSVYFSRQVCLTSCEALPKGLEGDPTGNSVGCRFRQAELAADTNEPESHCPAAGPGGNGVCGENCAGYCVLMAEICPEEFLSLVDCQEECVEVPDEGGFNDGIRSGNTIQCRLYHVTAAMVDPGTHCPHAGGLSPCQ